MENWFLKYKNPTTTSIDTKLGFININNFHIIRKMNKKTALFLLAILLVFSASLVLAQSDNCSVQTICSTNQTVNNTLLNQTFTNKTITENQTICIYFFYGNGCPHCANVEPLISDLAKKYPKVQIKPYEIYFNSSNQ